ncbi:UDP-glucose 4-epimerase, partial [Streptococcus pneumoniae]|nr:UDP-glucose 4-epimerase [Streptococcus pneumoniae]
RNLNYDNYFKDGSTNRNLLTEFNSNNTDLMDVEQVKRKLLELDEIQTAIRDMVADEEM